MNITYRNAAISDAPLLIELYNAAFYDDYVKYGECPAYGRSIERMEYSIVHYPKRIILCNDTPVGVISWQNKGNGSYYIGCLCVVPSYQRKGIGSRTIADFLSEHSDISYVSLITPTGSPEKISFYTDRCGFTPGEKRLDGNTEVTELYIKK